MTDWVRLWHDMPTDPKWRVIARKSGQPLACVIAVFNLLMVSASQNAEQRGTLQGWDDEDAAAALDMDPEGVTAIIAAMQGKVLEGERLTGWEKRQPKREDGTAAERKAAWKERQKAKENAPEHIGTQWNAPETDADAETDTSVSNETALVDPEKVMFDSGVALIQSCGKSEGAARSWLGKAKRDYGPEAVITMIGRAKREGAPDPIAFMEGGLRKAARARASPDMPVC